jgi:ABC-type glycerol-3-phosphate transport system permease component
MIVGKKRRFLRILATYLIVVVGLFFFIFPILWIIYSSFRGHDAIFSEKFVTPLKDLTIANYVTILSVTDFPLYFLNSFKIALAVTLMSLLFSIIGAYGLSRYRLRGKNIYIMGIFSTQMFPLVLIIIPIYLIIFSIRLLDTTLGVVFGQIILVLPFSVWMLKGYFDNLPEDLDDAALIDGCNLFQTLYRIILPVSAPGIMVAAFYSFVVSWGDYLVISIINQSQRTATIPLILQRLSSALLIRWGQVAAAAVLTIIPTVILFSFVQRFLVEGLTAGAIKGE